jgi:phosphoribosyl-ATP pyrophosphohydrolase/phosphoribosyl-AMP cyclohydrolase
MPAIVQDARSGQVLMFAYMNKEALRTTLAEKRATFFSRSKNRLWTKGESSGHWLLLKGVHADCDNDALLVHADPQGPTCHLGSASCFAGAPPPPLAFLAELDTLVAQRERERPPGSYTSGLFESGVRRIAQKVGEEGVETALAAVAQDADALVAESADLLFHLLVLLHARGRGIDELASALAARHRGG